MSGFKLGDLILSSKPFVHVLSNVERGKRCDYCFRSNESLKRCSQCSFAYFCNKDCQTQAWEQHKEECKCIKKVHPKEPTPSLRLLALLILKIKKFGYHEPYETVGEYKRSFADLESHVEEIKKDLKTCQQMVAFVGTLREYIGPENIPPRAEFTKIFGKMVINTFSICDAEMESIGSGLYLGASIFDHSCEPNAEVVFEGTTLTVRAVTDIPQRDLRTVYISYIDQMQLTEERQQQLQDQYYFRCQCQRCSNSHFDELMTLTSDDMKNAKEKEKHLKQVVENLKQMKKNKERPSAILEAAMETLLSVEGCLGDTNIYRLKMLEHVFEACIRLNRWSEAVATGLELLLPYRHFYGNYHPNYCILLIKIGKIELLLHQNKEAEKHFLMAEESTRISHGCSHGLYVKLFQLLSQCQEEMSTTC